MEEGWFEFWCLLGPVPRMDFITRHGDKKINLTRGGSKEADKILAIAGNYSKLKIWEEAALPY